MKITILTVLFACAGPLCAQNDSGTPTQSPGPQAAPAPNVNTGANPTAPAQLPSTVTGNPMQPTYPSGNNMPSWRGGTNGGTTPPAETEKRRARRRAEKARARRTPEPSTQPENDTAAPENEVVSPKERSEPNPGALQGGPQP